MAAWSPTTGASGRAATRIGSIIAGHVPTRTPDPADRDVSHSRFDAHARPRKWLAPVCPVKDNEGAVVLFNRNCALGT